MFLHFKIYVRLCIICKFGIASVQHLGNDLEILEFQTSKF